MQTCWWPLSGHWSIHFICPGVCGKQIWKLIGSELSALWVQAHWHTWLCTECFVFPSVNQWIYRYLNFEFAISVIHHDFPISVNQLIFRYRKLEFAVILSNFPIPVNELIYWYQKIDFPISVIHLFFPISVKRPIFPYRFWFCRYWTACLCHKFNWWNPKQKF